jgi:ubiquinone biosynthesis protein UbiJ
MNEKITALRYKKRQARNNLAGATWEQSISVEMDAISNQYNSRIDSLREEVDRLVEKKNRLQDQQEK